MASFERACADTQRAADAAGKAATGVKRAAEQLAKAAAEGDIAKIRRSIDLLVEAERISRQETVNATTVWPFSPDAEVELLRSSYVDEVIRAATDRGLRISRQDDHLVAFPSLIRIVPEQGIVRVDKTRVSALRPTLLVDLLLKRQNQRPRFRPEQFIEALHAAYRLVIEGKQLSGTTLAEVYKVFTLLPGSSSDYSTSDFTRDVFLLDRSGVERTKSGALLRLPASTGTKGSKGVFAISGPAGEQVTYYGIKFEEEGA
jgi:hypothetical protein